MNKKITKSGGLQALVKARSENLALFAGIRHRYELIRQWNGIEFVNDSKSTDMGSTLCSLEMTERPVHWILGDAFPGDEGDEILRQVALKVVSVTVLAENDEWAAENLMPVVDAYSQVTAMDDAILHALRHARVGSTVLFSPACPSFEMFENYKVRGQAFENELKRIIG